MNKYVAIALTIAGGFILISLILPDTDSADQAQITQDVQMIDLAAEVTSQFPTYPAAVVADVQKTDGAEGRVSYSFRLQSSDSIAKINQWYEEALSHGGWSIKSNKNIGGYQIIQGEKANLYTSMQAANADNGNVTISQQAQIKPN